VSIVIPDRDAADMLAAALASVDVALQPIDEPKQVIVVANGAPESAYADIRAAFAHVEFVHSDLPLGFGTAIARGLARARHDWVYLMNNDMTLDRAALFEVASQRSRDVFSVSSQIFQRSADGRREETGFTDWYVDRDGVHVFHAVLGDSKLARPHLAGSGGATLFRKTPLVRYVRESRCYDPFYWEDIEWGLRAWLDGYSVLMQPASHAFHRHRATTVRFYPIEEIDRVIARNRVLFDARNRATAFGADWLMNRVCDLDYRTQREMAAARVALETFRRRRRAVRSSPSPPRLADPNDVAVELAPASFSYRLRPFESKSTTKRSRLLLATPFAVYPPRHGGARRIAGLLAHLRQDYDVILVSDEAALYDGRSLAEFDQLCAVHLVWRVEDAREKPSEALERRMESHCHKALWDTVRSALSRYGPGLVQIEYAELAGLVRLRRPGERWVLDLHDAIDNDDFTSLKIAHRFEQEVLCAYDAVTVCSEEDRAIVSHANTVCVPNASSIEIGNYRPSDSSQLLFMGPFRYEPNLEGARRFLHDAFPKIRSAISHARIAVLGGDGAHTRVRNDPAFMQPGVEVFDHRDDVAAFLDASALTINPQTDIRGSSIKVIESLTAGRACVSTIDGARGFRDAELAGLVLADDIASMADPIIALLRDASLRHRIEAPDASLLARYQWAHSAQLQRTLYDSLLARTS
jgi:GT2 family glycosyltransferase/glycosyltransferase involved in cell wall biosynthesis